MGPSALAKKVKTPQGKKRKFDPLVNNDEKAKSLKVLEQINSKKSKIDITKAVGRQQASDEHEQSEEKKTKQGGKKGGKPGGKSGGKPGGAKFSGKAGGKKGG